MNYLPQDGSWFNTGTTGPSPDAVEEVARRLGVIAREIDILRLDLGSLRAMNWQSPAAVVFGQSLAERNTAMAGVVKEVETGAALVGSYAKHLKSVASTCPNPGLAPSQL